MLTPRQLGRNRQSARVHGLGGRSLGPVIVNVPRPDLSRPCGRNLKVMPRSAHVALVSAVALAGSTAAGAVGLGLAQPPSLGVACPNAGNVTTCGRIGISITLQRPALGANAELVRKNVRLHQGGFAGRGPTVWQGYVHIDRHRLGLPAWWDGSKPVRYLVLHLKIHYAAGTAEGAVRVRLLPGWG
jgi:hypothetical protein